MRPATINRKLVFIKRYATWASEIGLARHNNVASVRSVKPVAQGPRRPRGLSDLELKRFLREVENRAGIRDQAIVYALLETGLRVSELMSLPRLACDSDMAALIVQGKGGRERLVPLSEPARQAVCAWTAMRDAQPKAANSSFGIPSSRPFATNLIHGLSFQTEIGTSSSFLKLDSGPSHWPSLGPGSCSLSTRLSAKFSSSIISQPFLDKNTRCAHAMSLVPSWRLLC